MATTYYELLGVDPKADYAVIKAAYRRALKEHHPDVNSGDATAEQRSKKIIEAYEVLKNPELRAGYNHALRHGGKQHRGILIIVVLVSAGMMTSGGLLFLNLVLATKHGAPSGEIIMTSEQGVPTVNVVGPAPRSLSALEPGNSLQPATRERDWQAVEKTGTMTEFWAFAQTYPKTPEGKLAEIRLSQLIDASDDRAALAAFGAQSPGQMAERVHRRLERLAGEQPDITASLAPQEQIESAAGPAAPPSAAAATDPDLQQAEAPLSPQDTAPVQQATLTPVDSTADPDTAPAGDAHGGEAALDDLLASRPADSGGFLQRASAWLGRNDTTHAMADYDAAIRLDEASIPALHSRGLLWLRLGDVERALADLDHAIRLSFDNAAIYRDRGAIWLGKSRYDRAIADLDRAIKLAPDFAQAYLDRGLAYKRKGETEKAEASFDEAVRRDPALAQAARRAMSGGFDRTASESGATPPR